MFLSNLSTDTVIVHEFGHTAGLFHEQDHPDAYANEPLCSSTKKGIQKRHGKVYEAFDAESVMNYCHIHSLRGRDALLSHGDIETLLKIYGELRINKDANLPKM